jgi:hypothetical protein
VGGGREGVQVRSEAPPFPAPAARTYNMHCCCFFVVVSVGGGATARESKWRKISAVISHYHVNQADSFAAIHCSLFSVMDAAIGFFSSIYLFAQCVVCFFAFLRASERANAYYYFCVLGAGDIFVIFPRPRKRAMKSNFYYYFNICALPVNCCCCRCKN